MGAGIAADEFEHWVRDRLEQRGGQTRRQRNAERIAITGSIFDGDEAALRRRCAARAGGARGRAGQWIRATMESADAARKFGAGQIAQAQAKIVDAIGVCGRDSSR